MEKSEKTQTVLGIAEAQFKLDTSGETHKKVAEMFKRRCTLPRLQKLGLTEVSPEYRDAYAAVAAADKMERDLPVNTSPLALLAKAKMTFTQRGA